mmetsp:Transcript_23657/g.30677  ORF Transcript_23657/g.30677 Transcript_23657/m.30677 type:complete len:428 (+) Transcript_23657:57-1340(+)
MKVLLLYLALLSILVVSRAFIKIHTIQLSVLSKIHREVLHFPPRQPWMSLAAEKMEKNTKKEELVVQSLGQQYEHSFNRALCGDLKYLRDLVKPTASWDNPVEKAEDLTQIEKVLLDSSTFLLDPQFTVLEENGDLDSNGGQLELKWIKSATWPLPWRPRIQVLGKSTITADGDNKIVSIKDQWEVSPFQAVLKQAVPRFWDIYHFKAAPPAETPAYKVVYQGNGYEVREYAPRAVIIGKAIDYSNSREARKARFIPDFMFTNEISMVGKVPEQYTCTAPIEVFFKGKILQEGESAGKKVNLITWSVGVPTKFGHSLDSLPNPDGGAEVDKGQEVFHQIDPWRRVAVTSFNGQNQDVGVSKVRNELLEKVKADGFEPEVQDNGQLKFSFLQNDARVGFKSTGDLSLCAYEPRIIHNGNEVALQLKSS